MNELQEKQYNSFRKNKSRRAIIRNPYYTNLPKDTKVFIYDVLEDELCRVFMLDNENTVSKDQIFLCKYDELNFIDKEYSGTGLIKKGVRLERKDKYKGEYVVELLNDNKSIQFSQALLSLLQTNDNNYIGFAYDAEIGSFYIYASKSENDGYLLNKTNSRIISIADHRELKQIFESDFISVDSKSILDLENFPDLIFYSLFKSNNNTKSFVEKKAKDMLNEYGRRLKNKPIEDIVGLDYKMSSGVMSQIYTNKDPNEFEVGNAAFKYFNPPTEIKF